MLPAHKIPTANQPTDIVYHVFGFSIALLMIWPSFCGVVGQVCALIILAMRWVFNLSHNMHSKYAHMILCKFENMQICILTPSIFFSTSFVCVRRNLFLFV